MKAVPATDGSLADGGPEDVPVGRPVVRPRRLRRTAGLRHLVR